MLSNQSLPKRRTSSSSSSSRRRHVSLLLLVCATAAVWCIVATNASIQTDSTLTTRRTTTTLPSSIALVNSIPRGGGGRGGGSGSGGGWFGRNFNRITGRNNGNRRNGRHNKTSNSDGSSVDDDGNLPRSNNKKTTTTKKFPPLTQEEIESILHIPVFAISDSKGNGVAVRHKVDDTYQQNDDDDTELVYFFFSQQMAEQARRTLIQNSNGPNKDLDLRIMAIDLGKIWFKLLNNNSGESSSSSSFPWMPPTFTASSTTDTKQDQNPIYKKVQFRLVADSKNLLGARLLTNLKPSESLKLKEAIVTNQPQEALSIIKECVEMKPSAERPFSQPYNQIPFFFIPTMRATKIKQDEDMSNNAAAAVVGDGGGNKPKEVLPMFLGAKNMIETYLRFNNNNNGMSGMSGGSDLLGELEKDANSLATSETTDNVPGLTQLPQFQSNGQQQPECHLIDLHQLVKLMQHESDFDFRNILLLPLMEDEQQSKNDDDDDSDDDNDGGGDFGMKANASQQMQSEQPEPQIEISTSYVTDDENIIAFHDYFNAIEKNGEIIV